jgi:hypothetical protein
MVVNAAIQQFLMISRMLYRIAPHNGFSLICGKWKQKNHKLTAVGGLSYYLYGDVDNMIALLVHVFFNIVAHASAGWYMHYFNQQDVISLSNTLTEYNYTVGKPGKGTNNKKHKQSNKSNANNSNDNNEVYRELNRNNVIPMLAIISGGVLGLIACCSHRATSIVIATLTLQTIMSNEHIKKVIGMSKK